MNKIRDFIISYIAKKGIKQCFISEKTGLSDDTVSKILLGKRRILANEFLLICKAIDVPNEDIDKLISELNS